LSAGSGSRPPGFWANLLRRLATAAIALPLVLATLFLGPPAAFVSLVVVVLLLALFEIFALLRARDLEPMVVPGLLVGGAIFSSVALPAWSGAPLWPVATCVLLVATLRRAAMPARAIPSAAATLLGVTYLGALGGALAGLRVLEPLQDGAWRVMMLLAVIMGSDTMAFLVGHAVGRHRLAPALSPGKTVEGALGGLLGGVLGALAVRHLGLGALSLPAVVLLGLLVAGAGMLGDLFESLLKRWAGVKDSGAVFPGHGGALDRLDSLLFGAPVLYYFFFYLR
jgi:phosphatidate cytidylyltransferase